MTHPFNDEIELARAISYAKKGWLLFPSIYVDGAHSPRIKWGAGATSDIETIKSWSVKWPHCYYCVATQKSNIAVIDVDNKKGNDGDSSLFDLQMDNAMFPDTLKVQTPSNGFHYIFAGSVPATVSRLGKGLDTPVMIPLPGSRVEGKGMYTVLSSDSVTPAELPPWVNGLIGKPSENLNIERDKPLVELDISQNISSAITYLSERAQIATEGEGGDLITYQVACRVRDYGVSEEKALEIMSDYWNDRCEPPWDIEDLERKVKNAYDYAQTRVGTQAPQNEFNPQYENSGKDKGIIRVSEFKGTPEARDWVIEGWLPKGETSALYGDGGLGKSWLAIQLGLNVSSGEGTFLGNPIQTAMPVLHVACEDDKNEAHRRVYSILRSPEYEFIDYKAPFFIWPRVGENNTLAFQEGNILKQGEFYKELDDMIAELSKDGPILLILDGLSDVFSINENDRQASSKCIKRVLGSLIKRHGCTILVLAHPSKASQASGSYDSGSTGWRNSLRNMWAIRSHEDKALTNHRYLTRMKSNYSGTSDSILIAWENGRLKTVEVDMIENPKGDHNKELLMEKIREQCEKGKPFGLHHHKVPNLYQVEIHDTNGMLMSKDQKKAYINTLIMEDKLTEIRNRPRRNGLWPTDMVEVN